MSVGRGFIRGFAALLALSACAGEPVTGESTAVAATPPLSWQGVKRLQILCLVATNRPADRQSLERKLCEQVRMLSAEGAPVPVETLGFGDPKLINPDNATLLVHAHVQQVGGEQLLVLSIRNYRTGGGESDTIFGAPPRAVPLRDGPAADAALKEALRATLSETVPWLARPAGPRPI
jgi:hypothetical protein